MQAVWNEPNEPQTLNQPTLGGSLFLERNWMISPLIQTEGKESLLSMPKENAWQQNTRIPPGFQAIVQRYGDLLLYLDRICLIPKPEPLIPKPQIEHHIESSTNPQT